MTDHKIETHRDKSYPFKPYWRCVCGVRMMSQVMGHDLYSEFAQHLKESK